MNDKDFKRLFGRKNIKIVLPFTRQEFFTKGRSASKGMSLSGVQEKLSLKLVGGQLQPSAKGGEYILKPSPESFPHAAENEYTAMSISRLMKIDTAACGLVEFSDGEKAYITKRFDRLSDGRKRDQEDFTQIMGLNKEDKYKSSYESAASALLEAVNGKLKPIKDFFDRVLLAYVIGNDDLHLKNVSVHRLEDSNSDFYDCLTPNYDVLFTDYYREGGMKFLALLLMDDGEENEYYTDNYNDYGYYTGQCFVEFGIRVGLNRKIVIKEIKRYITASDTIVDLIEKSPMPDHMKKSCVTTVKQRLEALSRVTMTPSSAN